MISADWVYTSRMTEVITATLRVTVHAMKSVGAERMGDAVMEALEAHPSALDPIVSTDLDSGELTVAFEFGATGDQKADGATGLAILADALEAPAGRPVGERLDWGFLRRGHPDAVVQYAVAV